MNDLADELREAMSRESPVDSFRAAVKQRIDGGANRDVLATELATLRKSAKPDEEDVVLEVLDFLEGWCAPWMKI